MLKIVLLGMWIILVTVGAAFGSIYVKNSMEAGGGPKADLGIEEIKAEMTSIPLIRGGEVIGYLIIQLSFEADRGILAEKKIEPAPFLNDAAFRVIFSSSDVDFRHLRNTDLDRLTSDIATAANAKLGGDLIRHVLVQQLNFVRREDIRTNWIGSGSAGN